jgi:hypothetical protein
MLNVDMVSFIMMSVVTLSIIMQVEGIMSIMLVSGYIEIYTAERGYTDCCYAECCHADFHVCLVRLC